MGAKEDAKAKEEKAKAEAAAAEAARVKQINTHIQELGGKVTTCNSVITRLNTSKSNLTNHMNDWVRVYSACKSSEITKRVAVKNKFEGDCAKAISRKLPDAIKEMEKNKTGISNVISSIDAQISKLSEYVSRLNGQISSLRASI